MQNYEFFHREIKLMSQNKHFIILVTFKLPGTPKTRVLPKYIIQTIEKTVIMGSRANNSEWTQN